VDTGFRKRSCSAVDPASATKRIIVMETRPSEGPPLEGP